MKTIITAIKLYQVFIILSTALLSFHCTEKTDITLTKLVWEVNIDDNKSEKWNTYSINSFNVDKEQNIYIMGHASIGEGRNNSHRFIKKLDPSGKTIWSIQNIDDNKKNMFVDENGNIYIFGRIRKEYYQGLTKYDTNGNLEWEKNISSSFYSIDNKGNIYVVKFYSSPKEIIKYNTFGNIEWISSYNNNESFLNTNTFDYCKLNTDTADNLYITNMFDSSFVIQKYGSSGKELWKTKTLFNNSKHFSNFTLETDLKENVYLSISAVKQYTSINKIDNVINTTIKYDAGGKEIWSSDYLLMDKLSRSVQPVISTDSSNNVCVSYYQNQGNNSHIIKYDSAGSIVWDKMAHIENSVSDKVDNLENNSGNFYFTKPIFNENSKISGWSTLKYGTDGSEQLIQNFEKSKYKQYDYTNIRNYIDNSGNLYIIGNVYEGFLILKYSINK